MNQQSNRMSVKEFRELGLLHEVNRRLLHPLGLALEVTQVDDDERISGIRDFRDDPEGMRFVKLDLAKIRNVKKMEQKRRPERLKRLGYWIQKPMAD